MFGQQTSLWKNWNTRLAIEKQLKRHQQQQAPKTEKRITTKQTREKNVHEKCGPISFFFTVQIHILIGVM